MSDYGYEIGENYIDIGHSIYSFDEENTIQIEVLISSDDMGKVIGKQYFKLLKQEKFSMSITYI